MEEVTLEVTKEANPSEIDVVTLGRDLIEQAQLQAIASVESHGKIADELGDAEMHDGYTATQPDELVANQFLL